MYAFFGLGLLLISGCAGGRADLRSKSAAPGERPAVVKSLDHRTRIVFVDGVKTSSFLKFMWSGWAQEVTLSPGKHVIDVRYMDERRPSVYYFDIDCAAGKSYLLKSELIGRGTAIWVEDAATGQKAGTVLSSHNEPIRDKTQKLDQTGYFSLLPPPEDGWTVVSRDEAQTTLGRDGEASGESYALQVVLVRHPKFSSDKEFMDFYKKGVDADTDPKRFTINKQEIRSFKRDGSDCIEYYFSTQDHQVKMILEGVSYACTLPQEDVLVNFSYSFRHDPETTSIDIKQKAKQSFQNLTF